MSPDDQAMLAELRRRGDPVSLRAVERFETYHRMDREAATHVESVVAMRTGFTGDEPYIGWRGIGLALGEALDERDRLREACKALASALQPFASLASFVAHFHAGWDHDRFQVWKIEDIDLRLLPFRSAHRTLQEVEKAGQGA